jgi:polyisoprenyl-phosphate glycosyltransferase
VTVQDRLTTTGERSLISVVVPCFNEEEVIDTTHTQLLQVLGASTDFDLEVIYIDDGSIDRTAAKLAAMCSDARVSVVLLSRNFGHQHAVTAGLEFARGDAVVIMDADLQDPPELVLEFLAEWRRGADVVVGVRTERNGETLFKRMTAALFYRVLNAISEVPITNDAGDFRLMDRRVVDHLNALPERDRFIRGLVSWLGFNQVEVQYQRDRRHAGVTKYPLWKMILFALDGFVSFSRAPLRLAILMGVFAFGIAMVGIVYAIGTRLFTQVWVPGWTLLFIAVLLMGGVQLVALGVIGEYVGRVYTEAKGRPTYIAKSIMRKDVVSRTPQS